MRARLRRIISHARGQRGAVAIEAVGLVFVMLAAFMLLVVVGTSYWNLTLLNSTAQSVSLSEQSIMDRYCSPQVTAQCADGQMRANAVAGAILADASASMINGTNLRDEGRIRRADVSINGTDPLPGSGAILPGGWSYAYSDLKMDFSPLGMGPFPVRASSLTFSYRDPNR